MKRSVKFIQDGIVDGVLRYPADSIQTFEESTGSAAWWVRRGIAVEVETVVELQAVQVNTVEEIIPAEEDSDSGELYSDVSEPEEPEISSEEPEIGSEEEEDVKLDSEEKSDFKKKKKKTDKQRK